MAKLHRGRVEAVMKILQRSRKKITYWFGRFKKFPSQAGQDVFATVVGVFSGVRSYIEVGAGHPWVTSNTFALERQGWVGFGVDSDVRQTSGHRFRKNPCILADARLLDYEAIFFERVGHATVGYLSLDIDPPEATLEVLLGFPFDRLDVLSISYETDAYRSSSKTTQLSRKKLEEEGFICISGESGVKFQGKIFEDWWVKRSLFSPALVDALNDSLRKNRFVPFDHVE